MSDWNWVSFYIGTVAGVGVTGGLIAVCVFLLLCGSDESEVSEFPTISPTPTESGAESAHSGKQNTADKSGASSPELLPTQLDPANPPNLPSQE